MAVRVEGLRELEKALQGLKTTTARNIGRRAAEAVLQPVADAAKAAAPKSAGKGPHLADGIAVGSRLTRAQAREARVAGREGKHVLIRYVGPSAPHAHLVEFGTTERFHKSGKSVGRMPAQPFMRPAWDAATPGMVDRLAAELRVEFDKVVARIARREALAAARAARAGA